MVITKINDCVQIFTDFLPEIVCYFEQEAQNTTNQPNEHAELQEIHDAVVDPEFQLYLYFFQGRLPVLANINTQLQKSNHDFTSYQKIASFNNAFLEPILNQVHNGMQDGNIRTDVDDIDYEWPIITVQGASNIRCSNAQLHQVMKNVFFAVAIGRSLESRFPEMNFVVCNLCPTNTKHSRCYIEVVINIVNIQCHNCKDAV